MVVTARCTLPVPATAASPPPSASPPATGSTGASSSGRTKPRSMRNAPSLSMLTKTPARAISAGS
jgi:hypothetical protein